MQTPHLAPPSRLPDESPLPISLVIPLFNKAQRITACLASVAQQQPAFCQIVLVDDGSWDGSHLYARAFLDTHPELKARTRILHQTNQGVSCARNRGWRATQSDLVAFLDADDTLDPNYTRLLAKLVHKCPHAWLYGFAHRRFYKDKGHVKVASGMPRSQFGPLDNYFKAARFGLPVISSGVVLHRGVLDQLGGFPEGKCEGEDLYLWARVALSGQTMAACGLPAVTVVREPDYSRIHREAVPPYILEYFAKNPDLIKGVPGLHAYLRSLGMRYVWQSLRHGRHQQAKVRIRALAALAPCWGRFMTVCRFLPLRGLLRWLYKLRLRINH